MPKKKEDKKEEEKEVNIEELEFLSLHEMTTAVDIQTKIVAVPGWNGKLMIKGLTLTQYTNVKAQPDHLQAPMALSYALLNPKDKTPMVADMELDKVANLFSVKSPGVMSFLFQEIVVLSEGIEKPTGKKN